MVMLKSDIDEASACIVVAGIGPLGTDNVAAMAGRIHGVKSVLLTSAVGIEAINDDIDMLIIVIAGSGEDEWPLARGVVEHAAQLKIFVVVISDQEFPEEWTDLSQPTWLTSVAKLVVNENCFAAWDDLVTEHMGVRSLNRLMLRLAVEQITDLVTRQGFVCIDFADVKWGIKNGRHGHLGVGYGSGNECGARDAVEGAIAMLERQEAQLEAVSSLLINIYGSSNMTMDDFDEINRIVHGVASEEANIVIGVTVNDLMGSRYRVAIYTFTVPHWSRDEI